MKHYLDLVPIFSGVHKKQNRMSILCIVLAVFLVTTIFGMADMFIRSQILQTQMETGNWHIRIQNISDEDATIIRVRPDIAAMVSYDVLNYSGSENYTFKGTDTIICGTDDAFFMEIFPDMIIEGNFPNKDETMVAENARDMMDLHVGDCITISMPSGVNQQLTISGFVENTANLMNSDQYGIFVTMEKLREIYLTGNSNGSADEHNVYYVQFTSTGNLRGKIEALKSQCGLSDNQISENTKLLGLLGQSTDSFMMQIYASAAVLFVLVLTAGIMMITSSLNSNVAQRTEFFGLMRCTGATPKQVMRLVLREALGWCSVAIPVGICTGIIIIWILCFILRFLSPRYFRAIPVFSMSIPSIIAGITAGILTVLLAARTPAKRASKVSPLAAVSGNVNGLKPVKRAANTTLFNVDVALGIHHARASHKNFILVVGSFGLSIILFLAFSVTIDFMYHTLRPLQPWMPDLSIVSPDNTCSINHTFMKELEKNPAVKNVYGRMFVYDVPVVADGLMQKTDLISYEQKQFEWAKEYLLDGSLEVVQNELNTGLIVYEPQNTIQTGDIISLNIEGQEIEIKIVGTLSNCPFINAADVRTVICSEDTFQNLTGQTDYTVIDMQLKKHATDAEANDIHRTYGTEYTFVDKRMDKSNTMGIYYCVWLFLYGFLAIIVLITIFNIINNVALSVASRIKQYGVFRAIGLSNRQLSRMIIAEAATYAISGSVVGTILGLICNKFLFSMLIGSKWGDSWTVPELELIFIILIVFFSVAIAVYRPIRKVYEMSIVDTISAE